MPPSPICCSSLYGPMRVPATSLTRGSALDARRIDGRIQGLQRLIQKTVRSIVGSQERFKPLPQLAIAAALPVQHLARLAASLASTASKKTT